MRPLLSAATLTAMVLTSSALATESAALQDYNRAYVAGFLAATQLSQAQSIAHLADNKVESNSRFLDRAYRVRLGGRDTEPGSIELAGICMPNNAVDEQLVDSLLQEVKGSEALDGSERQAVLYEAVQSRFPC